MGEEQDQGELFRSRLEQVLNPDHPLMKLARAINWAAFEEAFGRLYAEGVGRPGLPTRLLVGLHFLKHMYEVSDEGVVAQWVENPYWQAFCGYEYFEHEVPCDPTSLVKWRHRVGAEGMERLLQETLAVAMRGQVLRRREVERVNVDTTVQEKAVAFPTDARLYHKARRVLVREARRCGIELRQSYERVGGWALRRQSHYAQAKQMRRARRETRRLRIYLGRVIRDIRRKCPEPQQRMSQWLARAERIYEQKREDKGKLYSLHAPEVECIAKGKAHKRYEFGCKVRVVSTSKRGWVVGIDTAPGNPYDGQTLVPALGQVQKLTGIRPKQAFVDKGFRGQRYHPQDVEVYVSGRRGLSWTLKALLRRRSAIEPVIGHLKLDHRMDRNYLMGAQGDRINAILSGCAFNLRKLMRVVFFVLLRWLRSRAPMRPPNALIGQIAPIRL